MLVASAPSRIVNLSSGGHQNGGVDFDDPNYERRDYDKWGSYGQAKSANILFTVELQRRYGDQGVNAYAVHPGMIATELSRYMTRDDIKALMERVRNRPGNTSGAVTYKSVSQGAATTVWAATSSDARRGQLPRRLRPRRGRRLGHRPGAGQAPLDPLRAARRHPLNVSGSGVS